MAIVIDTHKISLLIALALLVAMGLWVSTGAKAFFLSMAAFVLVVLLILFGKLMGGIDNKFIFNMAIAALVVRIVIAIVLHYTNLVGEADAMLYHSQAAQISSDLIKWTPFKPAILSAYGYVYFLSLLYAGFAPASLIPKLINCFVGVACGLYIYKIAYLVWEDKKVANIAGALALFLPGILIWSTVNLKEAWVNLLVVLIIFSLLSIRKAGLSSSKIVEIAICTSLLWTVRFYLALIMLPLTVFAIGVGKRKSIIYLSIVFILVLYGSIFLFAGMRVKGVTVSYEEIGMRQSAMAHVGGSATGEESHIENLSSALAFLPKGMLLSLFAPFPWNRPTSTFYALALPEMAFMYFLWIFIIIGIVKSIKKRKKGIEVIMFFVITLLILDAVTVGNIGTEYRSRMPIVLLLLVFAAGGLKRGMDRRANQEFVP